VNHLLDNYTFEISTLTLVINFTRLYNHLIYLSINLTSSNSTNIIYHSNSTSIILHKSPTHHPNPFSKLSTKLLSTCAKTPSSAFRLSFSSNSPSINSFCTIYKFYKNFLSFNLFSSFSTIKPSSNYSISLFIYFSTSSHSLFVLSFSYLNKTSLCVMICQTSVSVWPRDTVSFWHVAVRGTIEA
jgi:hypothetical protein